MASEPNHQVSVRPATIDDVAFMERLFMLLAFQRNPSRENVDISAIVQGTRKATIDQVRGQLTDSTTYVIELDGQPVGRLRVVRASGQIEIAGLQVLPACQRRGIGTAVIMPLLHEGQSQALPVVLQVDKDNPDAERLYRRLGFVRTDETAESFWMRAQTDGR